MRLLCIAGLVLTAGAAECSLADTERFPHVKAVAHSHALAEAEAGVDARAAPTAATARPIGLRFLNQNDDMDWRRAADPSRRKSYLVIAAPSSYASAAGGCGALSEKLADSYSAAHDMGLKRQLGFLKYETALADGTQFWVNGYRLTWDGRKLTRAAIGNANTALQAICTQSAPFSNATVNDGSAPWQVDAKSGSLTFRGFRDSQSFRFSGIPFGTIPQRFAQSKLHPQTSGVIMATARGPTCPQSNNRWSENCLSLQVFTSYLPKPSTSVQRKLRPVMVYLHGGGATSGSGSDGLFHGGMLVSRSDVVVVTINYRLGALGFLALDDGTGTPMGNYALGDTVTALRWVQKHIQAFGGDPMRVTIFGQSAGSNLVQSLLQTPQAAGFFHAAIMQSGKPIGASTARNTMQEMRPLWLAFAAKRGCPSSPGSTNDAAVVACLRALPASALIGSVNGTRPIMDGRYLTTRTMDISPNLSSGGWINRVPVMLGYLRDEMGKLGPVPKIGTPLEEAMRVAAVPEESIAMVLANPGIWPLPNQPDATRNLSMTVANEANVPSRRCGLQATMYALAANRVFDKVYGYVFDTRSYSSPDLSKKFCEPSDLDRLASGDYGMCHGGDLLPVFNTYGRFGYAYRDASDLAWSRNIADQWTAFARWFDPNRPAAYMAARGYSSSIANRWTPVLSGADTDARNARMASLGVRQYMQPVDQHAAQCQALGMHLGFIRDEPTSENEAPPPSEAGIE